MKRYFSNLVLLLAAAISAIGQVSGYPQSNLAPVYSADTGAVNALVVTLQPCPITLKNGFQVITLPANANTITTPTLNVCGFGAKTITKFGTGALAASDLTTTAYAIFLYDGTNFELQNPQTATGGGLPSGTQALPFFNNNGGTGYTTDEVFIDSSLESGASLDARLIAAIAQCPSSGCTID